MEVVKEMEVVEQIISLAGICNEIRNFAQTRNTLLEALKKEQVDTRVQTSEMDVVKEQIISLAGICNEIRNFAQTRNTLLEALRKEVDTRVQTSEMEVVKEQIISLAGICNEICNSAQTRNTLLEALKKEVNQQQSTFLDRLIEVALGGICNEIRNSAESRNRLLKEMKEISQQQNFILARLSEVTLDRRDESSKAALGGESSVTANERNLAEVLRNAGSKLLTLEDGEKKLCEEFNTVMSTLSMLPGCVLLVATGVSGFLSSDPQDCRMLIMIVPVVLCLLATMFLALLFAHQQLQRLKRNRIKLCSSRTDLHDNFRQRKEMYPAINTLPDPVAEQMVEFQEVNLDLKFQAYWYGKFIWLIGLCGLLYAAMVLIAGFHVVCKSKAIPLDPVADHLQFSPRVPSLRQYEHM